MNLTKEQLRAKWVEALRSGEFKQIKGALERPGEGNCCLGVLCRVYEKYVAPLEVRVMDGCVRFDGDHTLPPVAVVKAVGLRGCMGIHEATDGEIDYLTSMNDTGWSFAEIADVIEREPSGLFVEEA